MRRQIVFSDGVPGGIMRQRHALVDEPFQAISNSRRPVGVLAGASC